MTTTSANDSPAGYAGCIGLMGALAVALGIGAAAATTPGIAWADSVDNAATSPSDSDSDAGGDSATDGAVAPTEDPAATTPGADSATGDKTPAPAAPANSLAITSPSQSRVDLGDGVVLSSSGGAHTSSVDSAKPTVDLGHGVALSSSGGALTSSVDTAKPTTAEAAKATAPAAAQSSAHVSVPSEQTRTRSGHASSSHRSVLLPPPDVAVNNAPVLSASTVSVGAQPQDPVAAPTRTSAAAEASTPVSAWSVTESVSLSEQVPTVRKAAAPPAESVTQKALTALLGPLLEPGANGPMESPIMWALLAAARRQLGTATESTWLSGANLLPVDDQSGEPGDVTTGPSNSFTLMFTGSDADNSGPSRCFNGVDSSAGAGGLLQFPGPWISTVFTTVTTSLEGLPVGIRPAPDGSRIFTFVETKADGTVEHSLLTVDRATNALQALPVPGYPGGLTVSPDSAHVYFFTMTGDPNTGYAYAFMAVRTATGAAERVALSSPVGSIAVSPDSARVYVTTGNVVMVYEPTSGARREIPLTGLLDAGYVTFGPEGSHAYVTGRDESAGTFALAVIDTATEHTRTFALPGLPTTPLLVNGNGTAFVLSPNGEYGGSATRYHDVTVIDPDTTTARRIPLNGNVTTFLHTRDGTHIIAAYDGYRDSADAAGIFVIDTGTETARHISLPGWGPNLAISPNGAHVFAATYVNGRYQLSAIDVPASTTSPVGGIGNPSSVVVSPDGARAYFITDSDAGGGQHRRAVAALDTATNSVEMIGVGQASRVIVSPDGRYVLAPSSAFQPGSATYHHELALIDTTTGNLRSTAIPMPGSVLDIEFSPDSSTMYVTSRVADSDGCGFSLTAIAARSTSLHTIDV